MLRDQVNRFVSGFNSRRRRGRPLNNAEWDRNEAVAFAAFPTANDLAEALSVAQDSRRAAAIAAMRGIYHVKSSYADWLVDVTICIRAAPTFCRSARPADLPPTSSG